ncbi:hypothetical protein F4804DRAFT_323670 [Jackrogersella minutella]|nr:hypothetical protein F4804DRAFT_323670 [Jackrogersella minutella]
MASHKTSMDDSEAEPLYPHPEDGNAPCQCQKAQWEHKNHSRFVYTSVAVAFLIALLVNIILWVQFIKSKTESIQPDLFPSLAHSSAFRQNDRVFPLTVAGTPFAGDPSIELDKAWHDLLEGTTIRVAKEDLDYYNVTSLPLADGSGFASELFVTHELHCLVSRPIVKR